MTDLGWHKWAEMRERQTGYQLHVWSWADDSGLIHGLYWNDGYYMLVCNDMSLSVGIRVPVLRKLPTCIACLVTPRKTRR